MDIRIILEVIAFLLVGGLALYFRENVKLKTMVGDYIAEAEALYKDVTKAGGVKHNYVVEKLYSLIPSYLRVIISDKMVSELVDNAFSAVENYACQQLDKLANKQL